MITMKLADLFCGAGGTTTGAVEAIESLGFRVEVTAVNHWEIAVATHTKNHLNARHLCASIDSTNPRHLFGENELDVLLASPECMGHSIALGDRPVNDQSRSTAWCVLRWADALRPRGIIVENVPEFAGWAPLGSNGRPLKSRHGEVFRSWCDSLRSLGYKVDHRILCAADFGDPTTRRRLFIQAVRGKKKIVWPHPTHTKIGQPSLFASRPWVSARSIIDWSMRGTSIFTRRRPLTVNTIDRIQEGLRLFSGLPFILPKRMGRGDNGSKDCPLSIDRPLNTILTDGRVGLVQPFLVAMEHGGRVLPIDAPMPTITTAKGGAFGVVSPFLVQVAHGNDGNPNGNAYRVRSVNDPLPTVCGNRGEWAVIDPFLISYYGNGEPLSIDQPLDTVTTKDRFGLVRPFVQTANGKAYLEVLFRMLQPRELARAQGFRDSYEFVGTKTQVTKQIGNAVPRRLARALVAAMVSQNANVSHLSDSDDEEARRIA